MSRILIATATYNEEDSIKELLALIIEHSPTSDILIVDDSSTDKTVEAIRSFSSISDRINVAIRPTKLGVGSAHLFSMLYAINNNYDYLITLDADLSHHPKYLSKFIDALSNNEFVTGSRYIKGGS